LIVIKESAEEVTDWEAKSALKEGGKHQDLIGIGCWDVLSGSRTPLQHCAVWEKVIHNKFADFTLIHDGRLE
jgi:hypothetical protein